MEEKKTNAVGWFEIYVSDMDRAKKFYEGVFERQTRSLWDSTEDFEMWGFDSDMSIYGASGALVRMKGMEPGRNSILIYFSCEDCSVEESRVESFGGKVEKSKFSIGEYGFISMVIDTEGNMIGLHSLK